MIAALTKKSSIIETFRTHDQDSGSAEVQVALLTDRISQLTEHLKIHRKDYHSRRGLIGMTSRRRKLLNYIKKQDLTQYNTLIQKLKLRR